MSDEFEYDEFTQVILKLDDPEFMCGPGHFWTEYQFSVYLQDGEERQQKIGMMRAHRFNMGRALRSDMPIFQLFDEYSSFAEEAYQYVFDDAGVYYDEIVGDEDGMVDYSANFHILERIDLDPKFKGRSLAAEVTRVYLEEFANEIDVVYVKGYPLQFEAGGGTTRKFDGTLKQCQTRLCKYYEKMGMKRIGKTEHFAFTAGHFLAQQETDIV